jgi:hemerythrin superfamily protein
MTFRAQLPPGRNAAGKQVSKRADRASSRWLRSDLRVARKGLRKEPAVSTTDSKTQDAIELLVTDHREVDQMFAQIESGQGNKDELVRQITKELSMHAAVEEQILYPAMRRVLDDGDAKVEEAIQEHQEMKEALSDIERLGSSPQREGKLQKLMADVRHHVQEEEGELFPEMRSKVSEDELRSMGAAMASAKKMAPTHPHPNAPSTPPGNVVAGAAAAVMDKVRDAVDRT